MDKFITLSEAASLISAKSEFSLLYLAINQNIKLYWQRSDIQGLTITPLAVINQISDLTGEKTEIYKPEKTKRALEHELGPWQLDPQIDDRWPYIFQILKDKASLDLVLQPLDPPLRFTLAGEIYSAYDVNPHKFNIPRLNELFIDSRELLRIKKLLKGDDDTPIVRDLGNQRLDAIQAHINAMPPPNEKFCRGKRGYKDEVWQALKTVKAKDGTLLFAKKHTSYPDKSVFSTAWKVRKK